MKPSLNQLPPAWLRHVCLLTGGTAGIDWPVAVAGTHVHRRDNSPSHLDRTAAERRDGTERSAACDHLVQAGRTYVCFPQHSGHFLPHFRLTPA